MKTKKSLVLAMLVVAASVSGAFSAQITITGNNDYRAGSGGEFNVRAADAGGATLLAPSLVLGYTAVNGTNVGTADGTLMNPGFEGQVGFETFCIEHNEYINLNGTYTAAISLGSIYGGVAGGVDPDGAGGLPSTDLISVGTAYLYNAFATGTLADYTYTNGDGRAASAEMLQNAFWYLEDEISLTPTQKSNNPFLMGATGAITIYGDGTGVGVGGAKANNTIWNVAALNLWGNNSARAQDQLILHDNGFTNNVPPNGSLPDGGTTLVLLGLSLGGLGYLRRKFA